MGKEIGAKEIQNNSKIKPNIVDSVAETLFITLYTKSVETRKKDPLIVDVL
jgi:O-methyltransferase involved in polyketide biosynthesis